MKKIVVLNSGGFDSTTLLAELASTEECEIHSLYFDYGQPNYPYDSKCAKENAEKLGAIHHEIFLPKITWTKNTFYNTSINEYKTQYLEMRNVIFISYALSLAEGVGAEAIYMAILANGQYKDTNPEFIVKMRDLCETLGVKFETPYAELVKQQLYPFAKIAGVGKSLPFISCDTPNNGNPCGKCLDCECISEYTNYLNKKTPTQAFLESGLDPNSLEFQNLFRKEPILEMRVLLNNSCQLHCEHCYHGNNELIGDLLTDDELVCAIVEAKNIGINNFHFAGKEPLYDDRIFRIISMVKERVSDVDFTVVTNGLNLCKYAEDIVKSGISRVFLSVEDEFSDNGVRNNNHNIPVKNGIKALNSRVPVEIFYDLTTENIANTLRNLKFWEQEYNISSFHVRTLSNVGNAENLPVVSVEQICKLHSEFKANDLKSEIKFAIGVAPYTYNILNSENAEEIRKDLEFTAYSGNPYITKNYILFTEYYCNRYCNQITLTADGYVLGCAIECSVKEYDKISSGNIKEKSLSDIIKDGKEITLSFNKSQITKEEIFFKKCLCTPIDIV